MVASEHTLADAEISEISSGASIGIVGARPYASFGLGVSESGPVYGAR